VILTLGIGTGVVIATADNTVMGRIANLASATGASATSMSRETNYFIKIVIVISILMGAGFLIALLAMGYKWTVAIVFLIGIVMGNAPEGLLTTVTVS
jgi:sodium/potassium-transporting ATPase subunit alpha